MDENTTPPPLPQNPPPVIAPVRVAPATRRRAGAWPVIALVLLCLLLVSMYSNIKHLFGGVRAHSSLPSRAGIPSLEESLIEDNDSTNKIAVVEVDGIITSGFERGGATMVDYIQDQFKVAARDRRVKAVILKVNSPGGEVLASDDINRAIAKFQQDTGKPVVAAMGSLAASGGYYVSAPCRWIVANELTITGSIGVIMSTYNYRGLMDKVGLRPEVYKSGKFKDMLSGAKRDNEITEEEKQMVQSLVNETFERFKTVVSEGRASSNRKNKDNTDAKGQTLSSKWSDFADGRVLSGKEAYNLGFVDELGGWETAVKRAQKLAHIDNATLVQYQQVFDFSSFFRLFGKSETKGVKVDLGLDLPKLKPGCLYFLSSGYLY
jgi:protease IV